MTDAVTEMQNIRAAEDEVRHLVGPVPGQNRASDVYKAALQRLGHKVDGIPPDVMARTFRLVVSTTGGKPKRMAQDSAADASFAKRFPGALTLKGVR